MRCRQCRARRRVRSRAGPRRACPKRTRRRGSTRRSRSASGAHTRARAGAATPHRYAPNSTAVDPRARGSFAFDEGYLQLGPPTSLRVPYPVPFKLLGKEAEGYLDTLYLSERLRISKGNKGTTFVLRRK